MVSNITKHRQYSYNGLGVVKQITTI